MEKWLSEVGHGHHAEQHGMDKSVFVREAIMADLAAAALSAAETSENLPPMFSTFCWLGQITNQTLMAIMMPSHMPMPIKMLRGETKFSVAPSARACTR